jgi:hypothetical protein
LFVDSRYRTSGTDADFTVNLPENFNLPLGARCFVASVSFSNVFMTIEEGVNDRIYFLMRHNEITNAFVYTLQFGNYTGESLATEIGRIFRQVDPNVVTSFIKSQGRLQIIMSSGHAINILSDEELAEGFPEPLPRQEDRLAKANAFARDARVTFVEDGHYYLITNSSGEVVRAPVSVTGLLDRFKRKFDAEAASRGLGQRSSKYKRPDGSPMSDAEIRASWSKLGKVASVRGTLMHYQIEQYFNGRPPTEPLSPEMKQFLDFEEAEIRGKGLEPFRTEMSLFHCGLSVAGQCDMLCKSPDGSLFLLDWKRCKAVDKEAFRGERMKPPL